MASEEAQKIINRGLSKKPEEAARLIADAEGSVLSEVLVDSYRYGDRAVGLVRAIEVECQRRDVSTQMGALRQTATEQIGALGDVETATRDQIRVTERLERRALHLEIVAISLAVVSIAVVVGLWFADRISPAPVVFRSEIEGSELRRATPETAPAAPPPPAPEVVDEAERAKPSQRDSEARRGTLP